MKTQIMKLFSTDGKFTVIKDTKQKTNAFAIYQTRHVWSDEKNRYTETTRLLDRYGDLASCIYRLADLNLDI